jgi:Fe2+ transport system protein B
MVIRNATLTLVVSDTEAQLSTIMRMADELKGYVASSNTSRVERDVRAQLVLRVPAERLDEALDRLRKLAVQVREENVSGDDVTAEYVDLTSRVKNLEAAEDQLRGILAKTSNTDDVLKVFDQLKNVRGEIEQAKGRMQYLSQSAALATITLTLLPDTPAQPVEAPGWRPEGVAKSALERLIGSLQDLGNVVIWAALFILPLLLVTLGPVLLVVWLLRKRKPKATLS